MLNGKTFLAVIMARGGSTRLPNKNIIELNGKPLISYIITALQDSGIFDRIIVSTDSDKIASVAADYGAEAPFRRPAELADKNSIAILGLQHAVKWIGEHDKKYDYVCYAMPTSPLVIGEDFRDGAKFMFSKNADMILSHTLTIPKSIQFALPDDRYLGDIPYDEQSLSNTHLLKQNYVRTGAVNIGKWFIFDQALDYHSTNAYAFIMSKKMSIDIDDEADLQYAEFLLKKREVKNE